MLTQGESDEAHALRARGWSIAAIARHLGHDRKTIRGYLNGTIVPGQRQSSRPDPFGTFEEYCRSRLDDNHRLPATRLFEEITAIGYAGSYQSFTRAIRIRELRPSCEVCAASGVPKSRMLAPGCDRLPIPSTRDPAAIEFAGEFECGCRPSAAAG